jgi:hypothetical protein
VLVTLEPLILTASTNWQKVNLSMTYYNPFDSQIQCEEHIEVSPEEQAEVFQMMADEHTEPQDFEGYAEWSDELQGDFERQQDQAKDWIGGYTNKDDGEFYNGIAI